MPVPNRSGTGTAADWFSHRSYYVIISKTEKKFNPFRQGQYILYLKFACVPFQGIFNETLSWKNHMFRSYGFLVSLILFFLFICILYL